MKTRMSLFEDWNSGRESAPLSGKSAQTRVRSHGVIHRPRMRRAWVLFTWAGLGLLVSLGAPAQAAGISISVEPRQFSTDEAARLTVTLFGESVSEPVLPSVGGLQFHPAGQSSQTRIINGTVSTSRSHSYLVIVPEPGTYEIPPIQARVDGIVHQSAPVSLRVSQGSGIPRSMPAVPRVPAPGGSADAPEMSEDEAHSPAFLRIQPAKIRPYVGELVPVEIKAYFREALQARLDGPPQLDGTAFTWHSPGGEPQRTREVVGSQVYSVLTWHAGMSATKPGEYPVTAQLQATLLVPAGARSRGQSMFGGMPFDSPFGGDGFADLFGRLQERRVTLASQAESLRVESLPVIGQPADFAGAVGRFELSASATPVKPGPGDPVTVRTVLRGYGNFDRVSSPRLSDAGNFRTYDPTSDFEPRDTVGYEGVKTFEQAIIPKDPAVTEIPALIFTYFDPDAGQYQTVRTAPIPLQISSGGGATASSSRQPPTASQDTVASGGSTAFDGLEPGPAVHLDLGRLSRDLKPTLFQPWFVGLQALPLLAIGWGFHLHRRNVQRRDDPSSVRKKQADRAVADALVSMERALRASDVPTFLAACRQAVQERLGAGWGLPPSTITLADIRRRLPAAIELQRTFETADAVAYSGQTYTREQLGSLQRTLQRELDSLRG
jgi:hypothetical protein